jgi:hypothetical protein
MKHLPNGRTSLFASITGVLGAACGYHFATQGHPVDWPATGAMLQGLAAVLAAAAAAWGVNRWQEELRYKRNADLAEKVMVAVEGLVRSLQLARYRPLPFEIDDCSPTRKVLTQPAYEFRLDAVKEGGHAEELEAVLDRVAAIFGAEHQQAIFSLTVDASMVRFSVQESLRTLAAWRQRLVGEEALERIVELSSSLIPPEEGNDAFGLSISRNADKVRALFKSAL